MAKNICAGNKTLCDICSAQEQQHGRKAHKIRTTSEEEDETKDGTFYP